MSETTEPKIVLRCSSKTSDAFHVAVSSSKLLSASAFYRALKTSGMSDANKTEFLVPDVTENGLQLLADYLETPHHLPHQVLNMDIMFEVKRRLLKCYFYCNKNDERNKRMRSVKMIFCFTGLTVFFPLL
jgi:hypothetical protein